MTRRFGGVLLCAAAAALCLVSTGSGAQVPATAVNGPATLTITYELKGAGVQRPDSHEKNVSWNVEGRYTVTVNMKAQKPSGFGSLHQPDAAEQARESERKAATMQAASDMAPMMAMVEQIMKICGEDETCITRETMKMSQGIDPNSAQMQSAKTNIAKASVMPEERYQVFSNGTQQGTYKVKESAHEAYFDAACSLATEERCAYDTAVSGEGDTTDHNGAKQTGSVAAAEIDYQNGSLILKLTVPGLAKVKKTVTSKNPEIKTGTTEVMRSISFDAAAKEPVQVSCGVCQAAPGQFEKEVYDELLRQPAKLVVTWSFKRS